MNPEPLQVLLVEDNPGDARLIQEMLGEVAGLRVDLVQAACMKEAVAQLGKGTVAVTLLDLGLPDATGIGNIARVKSVAPEMPIVVITGTVSESLGAEAVQNGAQDYLVKEQVNSDVLTHAIRYAIERKRLEMEIRNLNATLEQRVRERTAELEASERRYHTLAALSPVGIFHTDDGGRCTYVNKHWRAMTGLASEEAMGNGWVRAIHPDDRERVLAGWGLAVKNRLPFRSEYRLQGSADVAIWVLAQAVAELDNDHHVIGYVGTVTDITESKRAEGQIRASLEEKEVLLKEIHHRVKNNMQIVSSLLHLQSRSVKDPAVLETCRECHDRIQSMAMIHEHLYRFESLAQIDFSEYARSLVVMLFHSYASNGAAVKPQLQIDKIFLGIDTAIPLGLIINEVVSNCLKHAFVNRHDGVVKLDFHAGPSEGQFMLSVRDDGVGLPVDFNLEKPASFGLRLVKVLAQQLGGRLAFHGNGGGTGFELIFQEKTGHGADR